MKDPFLVIVRAWELCLMSIKECDSYSSCKDSLKKRIKNSLAMIKNAIVVGCLFLARGNNGLDSLPFMSNIVTR